MVVVSQQETAGGSPEQQVVDVKERSTNVKLCGGNKKSRPYPRGGRLIKVRDNKRQEGFARKLSPAGRKQNERERERLKTPPSSGSGRRDTMEFYRGTSELSSFFFSLLPFLPVSTIIRPVARARASR